VIEVIDALLDDHTDSEVADILNHRGYVFPEPVSHSTGTASPSSDEHIALKADLLG
jgi:hypothetical protein